jgi:hypothetical protein
MSRRILASVTLFGECRNEAHAIARPNPGQLAQIVRLSSERWRQAVRQDCSLARKQASPPALLVVRGRRRCKVTEKLAANHGSSRGSGAPGSWLPT